MNNYTIHNFNNVDQNFIFDEIKNLMAGKVGKFSLINNLYYTYIDYFQLNQSYYTFELISYISMYLLFMVYLLLMII